MDLGRRGPYVLDEAWLTLASLEDLLMRLSLGLMGSQTDGGRGLQWSWPDRVLVTFHETRCEDDLLILDPAMGYHCLNRATGYGGLEETRRMLV